MMPWGSTDLHKVDGNSVYSRWERWFSFLFPTQPSKHIPHNLPGFGEINCEISACLQQVQHDLKHSQQRAGQGERSQDLQIKCMSLPPDPLASSAPFQDPQSKSQM